MTITGEMLIGARSHRGSDGRVRAVAPAYGPVMALSFFYCRPYLCPTSVTHCRRPVNKKKTYIWG
ncbi:hypothetical protein, partial [Azospirillum brasilense]|uniref:hypothetical protein n=1 Tax=Azospirillum brasilense TaxID=192 RepID=UPI001B3B9F63